MSDPSTAAPAGASSDDISIRVNGKPKQVPPQTSVRGLVERLGLEPGLVAVERNGEVVPRSDHERVMLAPNDEIEVVTFVGGG